MEAMAASVPVVTMGGDFWLGFRVLAAFILSAIWVSYRARNRSTRC